VIHDGPARDQMIRDFENIRNRLKSPGQDKVTPSELAATHICQIMQKRSRTSPQA
jgi:hypothetical protein